MNKSFKAISEDIVICVKSKIENRTRNAQHEIEKKKKKKTEWEIKKRIGISFTRVPTTIFGKKKKKFSSSSSCRAQKKT